MVTEFQKKTIERKKETLYEVIISEYFGFVFILSISGIGIGLYNQLRIYEYILGFEMILAISLNWSIYRYFSSIGYKDDEEYQTMLKADKKKNPNEYTFSKRLLSFCFEVPFIVLIPLVIIMHGIITGLIFYGYKLLATWILNMKET